MVRAAIADTTRHSRNILNQYPSRLCRQGCLCRSTTVKENLRWPEVLHMSLGSSNFLKAPSLFAAPIWHGVGSFGR